MTGFRRGRGLIAYSGGTVGDLHPIVLFSPCGAKHPGRATKQVYVVDRASIAQAKKDVKTQKKQIFAGAVDKSGEKRGEFHEELP